MFSISFTVLFFLWLLEKIVVIFCLLYFRWENHQKLYMWVNSVSLLLVGRDQECSFFASHCCVSSL